MPVKFSVAKRITLPLFKMADETAYYFKLVDKIFKSKPVNAAKAETSVEVTAKPTMKEPPELVQVVNLDTGEIGQIIVNTVLGSSLKEAYPNDSYVGKCFEIIRHKIGGGKNYAKFSITEISVVEDEKISPAKTAKK